MIYFLGIQLDFAFLLFLIFNLKDKCMSTSGCPYGFKLVGIQHYKVWWYTRDYYIHISLNVQFISARHKSLFSALSWALEFVEPWGALTLQFCEPWWCICFWWHQWLYTHLWKPGALTSNPATSRSGPRHGWLPRCLTEKQLLFNRKLK